LVGSNESEKKAKLENLSESYDKYDQAVSDVVENFITDVSDTFKYGVRLRKK
jgi:hypothetical protein